MATLTTQRSGNSSDTNPATSPWTGGTPPADGDVVVVATGHILTIDSNLSLGSTGSNVGNAITINATDENTYGKVIVNNGVILTLRGRDTTANTLLWINRYSVFNPLGGCTIVCDVPSTYASTIQNRGIIQTDPNGTLPITFTVPAANRNWGVQITNEVRTSTAYEYDHQRSALPLSRTWISNAAGTGLGSFGDSSLSFSSKTPGTICATEVATVDDVNGVGKYWVNYDMGHVIFWNSNNIPSLTCTYKTLDITAGNWRGFGIITTQDTTYNEAHLHHCVFEYMGNATDADNRALSFFRRYSESHTARRSFTVQNCTIRFCFHAIGIKECKGTAADPLLVHNNTIGTCLPSSTTYSSGAIGCYRSFLEYVTISNNTLNIRYNLFHTIVLATVSMPGLKIINNTGYCTQLIAGGAISTPFPGLLIDGNNISANGNGINSGSGGQDRIVANASGTAASRATVSNNKFLYMVRLAMLGSYIDYHHNTVGYAYHHGIVGCGGDDLLVDNPTIHHNAFIGDGGYDGPVVELGYNQRQWIKNPKIYNNTCVGPDKGFFGIGDCQDTGSYTLITGAEIYNNLVVASGAGSYGMQRSTDISTRRTFAAVNQCDYNWFFGPATTYQNYYRGGTVLKSGVNYNLGSRNVTGVSLYDPSQSSFSGKVLALTVNSASDVTLAWDGGAAQQLIFGSYTVASATGAGATSDNATVTVSGTPWSTTVGDAAWPKLCWIKFTSGALAGQVRAITHNTANVLTVAPGLSPLPAVSDTFVIYRSQVTLTASGGATIVAGIDAPFLPTTTQSDTDISFSSTDVIGTDPLLLNGTDANVTGSMEDYQPTVSSPLKAAGFGGVDVGAVAVAALSRADFGGGVTDAGDFVY